VPDHPQCILSLDLPYSEIAKDRPIHSSAKAQRISEHLSKALAKRPTVYKY